jgi:hypothetical protein
MTAATKSLTIEPKNLTALVAGVGLAVLLGVFFYFLSLSMGQDTFVQHSLIPYQ